MLINANAFKLHQEGKPTTSEIIDNVNADYIGMDITNSFFRHIN